MNKKFKVVANSTIMDAETNVRDYYDAEEMFTNFKNSGCYHQVYIMDNETGELYHTYNIENEGGGIKITEWFTIA